MTEARLTKEERRCLKMWFRQAIAELERNEASERLIRWHRSEPVTGHRQQVTRPRRGRLNQPIHNNKIAAV